METVTVLGAGLAGSECAWQLAKRGIPVRLVEMKPLKKSPAHHSDDFAELVCSNSLRSDELTNAVGLLKEPVEGGSGAETGIFSHGVFVPPWVYGSFQPVVFQSTSK